MEYRKYVRESARSFKRDVLILCLAFLMGGVAGAGFDIGRSMIATYLSPHLYEIDVNDQNVRCFTTNYGGVTCYPINID